MCRLVVCGPDRQIEIAAPAQVVVADLLPALLHHLGEGLADAGLAHGGWVLQRLGGRPLDEDATIESLGLIDGTVVYLRPRAEQIPPVHFDDLADGLASGIRERPGRWRAEMAAWASAGTFAVVLLAGLVALADTGPVAARAGVAAGIALVLLTAGFVFTRSFGDRRFGLVALLGGIGYGGLAGMIAPNLADGTSRLVFGAPQIFAGVLVATAQVALSGLLAGAGGPLFSGLGIAAVCAAAGAAPAAFGGLDAGSAGAIVAVLATVLTVGVPLTAFRLARIRLAPLPTKPEHLQEDIDPEPSEALLRQAAVADRYMTGLHGGLGVAATAGLLLTALDGGRSAVVLVVLAALVRLLAVRPLINSWHRVAIAGPAVTGLVATALVVLDRVSPPTRLLAVPALLAVLAVLLFILARTLPRKRTMPIWGRVGDVLQLIGTVALLPVLAAVLDLYGAARAMGG
ncbi:type VII secretion integral membrane protein EccD [Actinoplanes sp. HUAS TT8]|uniref:type VII secretion integral membrane protein EccD n=1 Tax=Actinoplanes sp. HUAS TT8 TaxID=3447453 RepID=UPI003F51FAB3